MGAVGVVSWAGVGVVMAFFSLMFRSDKLGL